MGPGPTAEAGDREVLVFVTAYNRQSWGQKILSRVSQHIFLASQCVGALVDAIPCTSYEIPEEIRDDSGDIIGYKTQRTDDDMPVDKAEGAVVCVENVLYGDGQGEDDYAEYVGQRESMSSTAHSFVQEVVYIESILT